MQFCFMPKLSLMRKYWLVFDRYIVSFRLILKIGIPGAWARVKPRWGFQRGGR